MAARRIKVNEFPNISKPEDFDYHFGKGFDIGQILKGPDNQLYQLIGRASTHPDIIGTIEQAASRHGNMANLAAMGNTVPLEETPTFMDQAKQMGYKIVPFNLPSKNLDIQSSAGREANLNRQALLDYLKTR